MKDIVVTIMTDGDFGTTDATITTDAATIMIMTTAAVVAEEIKEELEIVECRRRCIKMQDYCYSVVPTNAEGSFG